MNELIEAVKRDWPELRFVQGRKFAFRPPRTVVIGVEDGTGGEDEAEEGYGAEQRYNSLLFLHEVGHAIAGHRTFTTAVQRVKMEAEAWAKAEELAAKYGVEWDEEVAQGELDSYRDWLHRKARCPRCGLTRYQTPDGVFHCPQCEQLR